MQYKSIRALGVDFGEARIGLAITDDLRMLAHPLMTLDGRNPEVAEKIVQIAIEKDVQDIILGLPRNMDGSYGPAAEKVQAFAALLRGHLERKFAECKYAEEKQHTGLEKSMKCLHLWDERWTTMAAERVLRASGRKTKEYRSVVDQVAAQVLLQSWVDAQPPLS